MINVHCDTLCCCTSSQDSTGTVGTTTGICFIIVVATYCVFQHYAVFGKVIHLCTEFVNTKC
jgi:hypothetical protein